MDEKKDLDWQKSLGVSGQDLLKQVVLTNEDGFLLGGFSNSNEGFDKKENSRGQSDFWIIKLNVKGGEEWQKTIGSSGDDQLYETIDQNDAKKLKIYKMFYKNISCRALCGRIKNVQGLFNFLNQII